MCRQNGHPQPQNCDPVKSRAAATKAWISLPPSEPGKHRVVLDMLLRPHHELGSHCGCEAESVEELSELLTLLLRSGDERILAVADAISDAARVVRAMPQSSAAQRAARGWRLAALVDAADRLVDDPDEAEQVEFLPFADPDQLPLFDTTPALAEAA